MIECNCPKPGLYRERYCRVEQGFDLCSCDCHVQLPNSIILARSEAVSVCELILRYQNVLCEVAPDNMPMRAPLVGTEYVLDMLYGKLGIPR